MMDLYNLQIGFRAAIYRFYRYSTPVRALDMGNFVHDENIPIVESQLILPNISDIHC